VAAELRWRRLIRPKDGALFPSAKASRGDQVLAASRIVDGSYLILCFASSSVCFKVFRAQFPAAPPKFPPHLQWEDQGQACQDQVSSASSVEVFSGLLELPGSS
jgi:hypothetical protein